MLKPRLGDILIMGYVGYVLVAFLSPRVVQQFQPADGLSLARHTVNVLEESWYDEALPSLGQKSLYQVIIDESKPQAFGSGSPTASVGPYAQIPKHLCAGFHTLGWVQFKDGRVITGLIRTQPAHSRKNSVLCIDFNGAEGPNKMGQDVYFADFNPTGDFDTRVAETAFNANSHGPHFFWGNPQVGALNENGHPIPGASPAEGFQSALLARR